MTVHESLTPAGWGRGKGYSHGIAAEGRMIFVAGQVGWDENERFRSSDFVDQFRQALSNTKAILAAGGATPEHIVRMTWFIVDKDLYLPRVKEVGAVYREIMGKTYPAMAVIVVKGLIEEGALLEIETTGVIPA